MERRIGQLREAFDSSCDFFVVKALTVRGITLGPNQPFDKYLVEPRRLRQLYETRYLRQERSNELSREKRPRPIVEIGYAPDPVENPKEEEPKANKIKEAKKAKRNRAA